MSNISKKFLAIFLLILMITSVSFNTICYGVDAVSNIESASAENIIKVGANNVTASNTYDLMITNRNNTNQAYSASAVAKNVNSGDSADYDVLLTQDTNGQYYYCMEKGGALMLYANGGTTLREFYYSSTAYKNITKEQGLALIYLNAKQVTEINGISLNTNNNREKLIQYYIWKSGINQGNSVSVPSAYAEIISSLQKCVNGKITIGNDILDTNNGILTINGEEYTIDSFSAYEYTSQLVYRRDNGNGYIESNYVGSGQEMFSFSSSIVKKDEEDKPQIQIYKHDENGNAVPGVEFTITEWSQELTILNDKLTVNSNGYTNSIDIDGMENGKTYTVFIEETYVPDGYQKIDSEIELTIIIDENGNISWGANWLADNEETEIIGTGNNILIDVENIKENIDKPQIQIYKYDENGNVVPGVEFTITEWSQELTILNNKLTVSSNGYTNSIDIDGMENGKTYTIFIEETYVPDGYQKIDSEIELTIIIDENGNISWGANWLADNEEAEIIGTGSNILIDVENKKEDISEVDDLQVPLLMYIKGYVFLDGIEGKESVLDGYFNSENDSDKGLEGIKVEIYDEATNALATLASKETLTLNNSNVDTSSVDWTALGKYGKATMYTDENGFFEFYGLNPSHTYYIIFTYNGMRYAEIKATTETGMDILEYDMSVENASKAVEIDRQSKINNVFSEIGTYPYNYYSSSKSGYNIAYNQDDVEEAIKNGLSLSGNDYEKLYSNLSQYMDESLAYFIQDCQVTAQISGLGNILEEAENKVKEYNGNIKENAGSFVYPVVEYHSYPSINQVEFEKNYEYIIMEYYSEQNQDGSYGAPSWHYAGKGSVGTLKYDERIDGEWELVKDYYIQKDIELTKALEAIIAQSNSYVQYTSDITGHWTELEDGYKSETISGVEWATFDTKSQQYLGDWYAGCESVTYKNSCDRLKQFLAELNSDINTNLPCANLGVQYRNTFDMALYNDVLKADVTVNGVLGTYEYDKRAANGNIFSFGVNEYDLKSYYGNLSDSNVEAIRALKYNTTISSTDSYLNLYRKYDIYYSSEVEKTDNGVANAGGYDDDNNSIYLTYKIRLINQSSIKGTITEIVDYYDSNFELVEIYDENGKEYNYRTSSIYAGRGNKNETIDGYSVAYIELSNMELSNNESQYLYIVLKMKDIRSTLTTDILDGDGYETLNYAEINGYKTENGYIDIDSMPGNIINTNRFENGEYEDDENKSPTLIFKNPDEEGRTISGVVFEDATTGEWSTTQTRQSTANNEYDENDILIQGVTVQLIQILSDGTEKVSAQTTTTEKGEYKFQHIRPGNYVIRFAYGNTDMTTLTSENKIDDQGNTINVINEKSYNGESYENTEKLTNTTLGAEGYWYTDSDINTNARYSDAIDNEERRNIVTNNFATLTNENAEILSSYKDSKVNRSLVNELKIRSYMYATTDIMKLEMEYVGSKNENTNGATTIANDDGQYTYTYNITNVDFGIVERSRAKLDIEKYVSYISLIDSTGNEITGGTYQDWKNGNIKYVKWITGANGFVDMEIDTELLNGATLKITYEITVIDNSEAGNEISEVEVLDYVTNNLNYADDYTDYEGKSNSENNWEPITTTTILEKGYVNSKSLETEDDANKIDLSTYQTILKATFKPGETKTLTLEKNLSSEEESNFNYSNNVEIVSSKNSEGRGDYYSIYGNLDPNTYTSRQGNLYWDFIQGTTSSADNDTEIITESSGLNAIRIAEGDSGCAEKTMITPPEGSNGIVIFDRDYILAIVSSLILICGIALIRKYKTFSKV